MLPAGGLDPLGEHRDEAAVVVDDRESDGLLVFKWRHVGRGGASVIADDCMAARRRPGKTPGSQVFQGAQRANCGKAARGTASPDLHLRLGGARKIRALTRLLSSSANGPLPRAARLLASRQLCAPPWVGGRQTQKVAGRRPVAMIRRTRSCDKAVEDEGPVAGGAQQAQQEGDRQEPGDGGRDRADDHRAGDAVGQASWTPSRP